MFAHKRLFLSLVLFSLQMAVIGQQSSSTANLTELQVVNLETSHGSKSDWATLGGTWWGKGKKCVPSTPTWTSRCYRCRLQLYAASGPGSMALLKLHEDLGSPYFCMDSITYLLLPFTRFLLTLYTDTHTSTHTKAPTEVLRCILKVAARPVAGSWVWAVRGLCYTAFTVLFVYCFVFLFVPAKETFSHEWENLLCHV